MKPHNDDEAIVDVLDVILRDGAMIQADVMIGIADVPLVGINLRAAVAGMSTMTEYGYFDEWDERIRHRAVEGDERQLAQTPGPGDEEVASSGNAPE